MKSKHNEEFVYRSVLNGDLQIEPDGTIWRVKKRGGYGSKSGAASRPCARKRAENNCGSYFQVRAMFDGHRVYALAHRVVYRHFFGPILGDLTVNHKDGVKKNNHPSNLELATHSEQITHAYRIGLKHEWGEINPAAKIKDAPVPEIRHRYASTDVTQSQLAAEYGLSFQQVSRIVRGERRPKQDGPTADYTSRRYHASERDSKGRFKRKPTTIPTRQFPSLGDNNET